jgi:hypothetical protein
MPLPPIAFYSIYEISARWGCHPADVAGWAAAGHFQVLAGISSVSCGDESVAGLVDVPIAELMPIENGSAKVCHGSGGIVLLQAE